MELDKTSVDITPTTKGPTPKFINHYSEILIVYVSVPALVISIIGVLIGIILFVYKSEFDDCKSPNDMLFGFLLGQLIFFYSFGFIYSNLILQIFPLLQDLSVTFYVFLIFFLSSTGWSLWGTKVLSQTKCVKSVYYGISTFSIALIFALDILVLIGFALKFYEQVHKLRVTPSIEIKHSEERSLREENNNAEKIDDLKGITDDKAKEGWKEDNMEGF